MQKVQQGQPLMYNDMHPQGSYTDEHRPEQIPVAFISLLFLFC